MPNGTDLRPLIVVGVDGSDCSKKALDWAEHYAAKVDGYLRVIMAWQYPAAYGYVMVEPEVNPEGYAEEVLEKLTSGTTMAPDRISASLLIGPAAPLLIEESKGADLLVVGSHGRGAFTGMLLGSVSTHCVHHAKCPIVVAR